MDGYIDHVFWSPTLSERGWLASAPAGLEPVKVSPGAHWIEGWARARTSLSSAEERTTLPLPVFELLLRRPFRCQLYCSVSYKEGETYRTSYSSKFLNKDTTSSCVTS
jgi:hypothetical protein